MTQNSLIWYDEPEKEFDQTEPEESGSGSGSDNDEITDDKEDEKSPHENYRDFVSLVVEKEFADIVPFHFVTKKDEALNLIRSSVKNTLMVSGRAGVALIDLLYECDMIPVSTISNIIVFCNND